MRGVLHWGIGIILALHGLVHLLGFAAYLRLAPVATLPYKTALLGGRLEIGTAGMSVFGLLWGMAALGFVLAAATFLLGWGWRRPVLIAVTLLSLALTTLDAGAAFAGVAVNTMILLALWFESRRGLASGRSKVSA